MFKDTLDKLNVNPADYGLHSPKVGSIVELVDNGAELRQVEVRVRFAHASGMAERYSMRSTKQNTLLDLKLKI